MDYLYIKEFSEDNVVISNGKEDFLLEALNDYEFDRDLIEDILDSHNRDVCKESK